MLRPQSSLKSTFLLNHTHSTLHSYNWYSQSFPFKTTFQFDIHHVHYIINSQHHLCFPFIPFQPILSLRITHKATRFQSVYHHLIFYILLIYQYFCLAACVHPISSISSYSLSFSLPISFLNLFILVPFYISKYQQIWLLINTHMN